MDVQSDPIDDDGGGYLIAVSDMMAALLFVFLITLVAFVINFQFATVAQEEAQAEAVAERELAEAQRDLARAEQERLESVRDDLTNARRLREEMLESIRQQLEERGIRVEIDSEHGILRLTENAISFESGKATLAERERAKLAEVAAVLADVIPCYSANAPEDCQARTEGKLEAVFIEGHTDNVPLQGGRFRDNWDLSAQRAMYTYRAISKDQPALVELSNQGGQPLFSVSGYGAGRPVVSHDKPTADPRNRRIDLRFIMTPPTATADPEPVRALRERGVR
jgi:flagellar motor protein MotB